MFRYTRTLTTHIFLTDNGLINTVGQLLSFASPAMGSSREVSRAGAGEAGEGRVRGGGGVGVAGAAVRLSRGNVSSRLPEVAVVDRAKQPPSVGTLPFYPGGGSAAWVRQGGGDCAQTRESGEYLVYLVWPACDCDDPGAARGLSVSVRVGSPRGSPSRRRLRFRKSRGFSVQFEFSFENNAAIDR